MRAHFAGHLLGEVLAGVHHAQHDAFDVLQDRALIVLDLALAVDGYNVAVRIEVRDLGGAEIKHRPA